MERISVLSKETLVPLVAVVMVLAPLVGIILNLVKANIDRDISDLRIRVDKVEDTNTRQDREIQDARSSALITAEVLKSINEKLEDLKKSLQSLQATKVIR